MTAKCPSVGRIGASVEIHMPASARRQRRQPGALGGATARFLLIFEDPQSVTDAAVDAGATLTSTISEEHDGC
jgi:hypothetical protein